MCNHEPNQHAHFDIMVSPIMVWMSHFSFTRQERVSAVITMSKIKMLRKEAQVALPNSGETYIAEDGTVSMVLDDNHDQDYEPTDQEIKEYAQWLGMEFPEDEELLWLAREGLKAPLPKEWKPCKTDTGDVYYFNFKSGDSIWDHPMDEHFKSKFKTEKDRLKKQKESGGAYQDTLTKVASRNNIVFTDKGVVKHESLTSPVTTPRKDEEELKTIVMQQGKAASSTSASSTPISSAKSDAAAAVAQSTASKKAPAATAAPTSSAITPVAKAAPVATTSAVVVKKDIPKPTVYAEEPAHAADPQPESPRLVSEAEKILQERVRQEAEADHKKKLQNLEDEWSRKTTDLRTTGDNDIAESKRQLNINKRNQISKIEDALQEELEQQQRNIDQRSKREIQQLQDDIEDARERSRSIQQSGSKRADTDFADVERRMRDALATKVGDIEGEISSIRMRHAKAQMDAVDQEKQRIELEANRISVDCKEKVSADYEARAGQLRAEHAERLNRLRGDAQRDMDDETRRSQQAAGGNQSQLVEELRRKTIEETASIRKASDEQVRLLRDTEEAKRVASQSQIEAEIAGALRSNDSGATLQDQETFAAVDADADAQIRQVHDRLSGERAVWAQSAALLRQQALDAASASSSSTGSHHNGDEAQALNAETSALLRSKESSYAIEEASLRSSLSAEAARLAEGNLRSATLAAVQTELDNYIAQEQRRRATEASEFEASKLRAQQEHAKAMGAYEDQIRKHSGAAPPTITENVSVPASREAVRAAAAAGVQAAVRAAQLSADQALQTESKDLRAELARQHSDAMLRLADELATLEQDKRRVVDAALTASAGEYERSASAATPSMSAPPPATKAPVSGVPHAELVARLEGIRAEFREREATLRAELNGRLYSSRTLAASIRQAAATLRSKSFVLEHAAASAGGLPPRSTTPHMRQPSPQPAGPHDALAFLAEQQRGISSRQELLAHGHTDGAWHEHHHEPEAAQLHALDKYYRTQVTSAPRHADPTSTATSGPDVNSQIVAALHKLNSKLENLSARVAHISSAPEPRSSKPQQRTSRPTQRDVDAGSPRAKESKPKRTSSRDHHHQSSPQEGHGVKRRDSSADLAAKWGGILHDVTKSKSHKTSAQRGQSDGKVQYEDAIRHYLHDE